MLLIRVWRFVLFLLPTTIDLHHQTPFIDIIATILRGLISHNSSSSHVYFFVGGAFCTFVITGILCSKIMALPSYLLWWLLLSIDPKRVRIYSDPWSFLWVYLDETLKFLDLQTWDVGGWVKITWGLFCATPLKNLNSTANVSRIKMYMKIN